MSVSRVLRSTLALRIGFKPFKPFAEGPSTVELALSLNHKAIESLKWPAMTMDFKLAPDLQKSGLGAGQEVEIEFRMKEGDDPLIVALRRIDGKEAAR